MELQIELPTRKELGKLSYDLLDRMDDYLYVNHIIAALKDS